MFSSSISLGISELSKLSIVVKDYFSGCFSNFSSSFIGVFGFDSVELLGVVDPEFEEAPESL
jgi:hypothetical protein